MIDTKKIIVVLPAYNASNTLLATYREIPFDIVDDVILVDDNSTDNTVDVAKQLDIKGRSRMTKAELVASIDRANQRASAKALEAERVPGSTV